MKKQIIMFCISIFLISFIFSSTTFSQSGYKVTGTITIGGEGRWDYLIVDSTMHRLYVSHSTMIHIIDLTNNKVIGEIKDLHGVHGIAICPESGKGFISNGQNNTVTVFDVKTFKVTGTVETTGKKPDAIVYEPFSKRVFTFNGGSANATAIDGITGKVVGTVKLDGNPEFAVSNNMGKMYVNLEEENAIEVFDPMTLKVTNKWLIAPVTSPSGLAMDLENNRLFSVGKKMMAIVDAENGKMLASPSIGDRVDGCAFDQLYKCAFSSNGEGTMTVISEKSPNNFPVVENVKTLPGARTITIDQSTHKLYTLAMVDKVFSVLIIEKK
jgi:YVTN family beta-propeller protein